MDADALIAAARAELPGLLVALDFDGTLAPIVPDPNDSRPVAGAVSVLTELARAGAHVAVVTGRDARTVLALGGLEPIPGLIVEGLYGAERWHQGRLDTPDEPDVISTLRTRLPALLTAAGADPKVWIEDKRLSLVVHARLADDPEAALAPLAGPVGRLAAELALETHPGRGVIELRLPGIDKAGALDRLVAQVRPRAVLYAGDDVGDLPAMAAVATLRSARWPAWSVAVSSGEVPQVAAAADLVLADPAALVRLLAAIARPGIGQVDRRDPPPADRTAST